MRTSRTAWMLAAVMACFAFVSHAQEPVAASADQVEMDPIRCWWRAEKAAVRVGEQFGLVLTCSVIETRAIRVVPQTAELEPAAIALIPFEIVSGVTHEEFNEGPWRYFQFEYSVRLMAEDLFGQDVVIPSVPVTYNVQSMADGGAEGMDQTYLLPALPVRVLSLVPDNADDIRDAPAWTFGDMEERRFRASLTLTIAWVVFGFAAVAFLLAFLRGVGHLRRRRPVVQTAPIGRVLSGCTGEMSAVQAAASADGWSPELVSRASAAFRIVGAVALDRPVSQTLVDPGVEAEAGQILVKTGLLRPRRLLVSASTTPAGISEAETMRDKVGIVIDGVKDALCDLNAARYVREDGHINETALDERVREGVALVRRLRSARRMPGRSAARWLRAAMGGGAPA